MRKQAEDAVDERARLLFKLLVERYIADGSPVASKLLASSPEIEVSSATVRNIMAELALDLVGQTTFVPLAEADDLGLIVREQGLPSSIAAYPELPKGSTLFVVLLRLRPAPP